MPAFQPIHLSAEEIGTFNRSEVFFTTDQFSTLDEFRVLGNFQTE